MKCSGFKRYNFSDFDILSLYPVSTTANISGTSLDLSFGLLYSL